ncbi:S-adenosyl-L-methionine-dependent methyltransferase [Panus rudis PR-1116 ss-1]|nr:S-adenosyl-L-methionine-dependent methyltransferase [Panus rudis PR-1116 ss-1]
MDPSFQQLDDLVSLITTSVNELKAECLRKGYSIPNLDSVDTHPYDNAYSSAILHNAIRTIRGACTQLSTVITPPVNADFVHLVTSCTTVALEGGIADILKDHPDGLHVSKIAESTKIDEQKLASVLRLLCAEHCFREVSPNVFANNRLSAVFLSDRISAAGARHFVECSHKAGTVLYETLTDPVLGPSRELTAAPFSRAHPEAGDIWRWTMSDPARLELTSKAMIAGANIFNLDAIATGFPYHNLPSGASICDVGGGFGHITQHIAMLHPHIRVILQDMEGVLEKAKGFWAENAPDVVKAGRVEFVPIDFIKESPVPGSNIYFVNCPSHNWDDAHSRTILSNIRKVMKPESSLIVQDYIIQFATRNGVTSRRFAAPKEAPEPLLPNFGGGGLLQYFSDLGLLINARERTIDEYIALGKDSGLELVNVYDCGETSAMEFKPA